MKKSVSTIVKKKIIDCFTFFDEHELLMYRLNLLNDVVDKFILVEATHTHRGNPKPLHFDEKKHLYTDFMPKIVHIIVDDFPFPYSNLNLEKNEQWANEMYQRRCIEKGLEKLNLSPNDLFTVTDLDEIPDPKTLYDIKNGNGRTTVTIQCLEMDFYYYNLHTRHRRKWYHPKICNYQSYKNYGKHVDEIRMTQFHPIQKGGWHLSYFGDKYRIQAKINRCLHTELSLERHNDLDKIESNMKNHRDLYGRPEEVFENIPNEANTYLPTGYETFIPEFM